MKKSPLEFYKSRRNGRWYWRLFSKNGKKIAHCSGGKESGYLTQAAAKKGYASTARQIIKLAGL